MLFDDHAAAAATSMAAQLDNEIRRALDYQWPGGWTYEDVRKRCVMQRVAHDPVETFIVDGTPLLHIWPVTQETEHKADRIVMRFTRNVRRLYKDALTGDKAP